MVSWMASFSDMCGYINGLLLDRVGHGTSHNHFLPLIRPIRSAAWVYSNPWASHCVNMCFFDGFLHACKRQRGTMWTDSSIGKSNGL